MSPLRVLGASALTLLMPSLMMAAGPGAADVAEPETSTASRAGVAQTVRLVALPQIVQPGGRLAKPNDARAAFVATIDPISVGRPVRLQVLNGTSWDTVATGSQNGRGRAEFAARASRDGEPLRYRVRAVGYQSLPAITSSRVSTERWLSPTWTDQFSRTSLSGNWSMRGQTYEPWSKRACSKGSPKAVKVGGGVLRLSVLRDSGRDELCPVLKDGQVVGRAAYRLNGHIGTQDKFSFRYGVAAARIKYHPLRGQHGSFWSQPASVSTATGHEIDISEFFGGDYRRGGLYNFIYRNDGGTTTKLGTKVPDAFLHGPDDGWAKNYHVYSVQWTPKKLVFRVDGKETWRIGGRVSQVQQFLILSLLSSDYELPLIQDSQLPQHMYVDWVRVWETGA